MAHGFSVTSRSGHSKLAQKGAVLIFLAFILGLGAVAYLLKTFNTDNVKAKQDEKTYQTLKNAKQALIAWAVSNPNVPGLMPYPDRNGDGNYDDTSDCYASNVNFNLNFVIGRLPLFRSDPNCVTHDTIDLSGLHDMTAASGLSNDFRDGTGERLWYEVSQNLLHDYKSTGSHSNGTTPIINPDIVNNPTYPWLVVRDRNGSVMSNRVAAVILSPGSPIGTQDRSSGIADANQYLDKIVMANGTQYKNYGYPLPGLPQEFIVGDDMKTVAKNDPTYKNQAVEPYYFNDKLVYITIDELMYALEKRVAAEVKVAVKNYKLSTGYNPYAAIMGADKNYSCVMGKLAGALPIKPSHSSSCTYTRSGTPSTSSCSFTEVASVIFTKTSTNFTGNTGACQFSGKVCTCNGAGSCSRSTQTFTCDAAGACSANTAGTYKFSEGGFDSVTSPCATTCGSDITCTGVGVGTFTHSSCTDSPFNDATTNSKLPIWFTNNLWQDYIYYAAQRGTSSTISAGGRSGITALTVTTGYPIIATPLAASKGSTQLRLSCNLADYMDTSVNATSDVTNNYEQLSKAKSSNYNDQIFVISP
jgi:hypothetical protein